MKTITFRLITYLKYSLIFTMLFTSIGNLYAQSHTVSGTITHDGVPLLGATIMIKDTHRGTTSNMDGYFELTAQDDDTLVVSYLGYETKEIPIQGRTTIDIELTADADMLDAVEITGAYYSLDERTRTGNVTKINTDQFEQQVVHSPMEALQGRVAGLEIETRTGLSGQAPLVTLRGQGSIRAFGDVPLYVLDGVPLDNSGFTILPSIYDAALGIDPLATLDPSLIESIEVLKDADATAIYGSRGANGVIIINTKRGQSGKTKFEMQAETGVSRIGKFMKLMNTEQYIEMRHEAFANDGVTPTETNAPDLLLWDQNRYTDWQKELIGGNAEFQKYQASVSGGNEQTAFLLSGGFQKEGTVIAGDFGFQNNNLLANINHRSSNNKLKLNTSINYGYRKSNLFHVQSFFANAVFLPPNAPELFGQDGEINWELDEFGNPTFTNPMAGLANPNTMRMKSLQWNGNVSYQLLKGVDVKINLGYNSMDTKDNQITYKRNSNPIYAATAKSTTNKLLASRTQFIVEPQLNYKLNINNHKVSSLIGSTFQKNENSEIYLRGEDYLSESQVGNTEIAKNNNIFIDQAINYRYAALFGRVGYSFADKYYLNLTGRRDGSSRFGKKNRFGNFGAVGIAWEFHKEEFISDIISWLNYGKLRASYGSTGSDNIGDYQYRDTYNQIRLISGSLSQGGLLPSKLSNPYYQWEKRTKLEVAFDFGLLQDKVQLSTSWYKEHSGNQLVGLFLPSITGFSNVQGNLPATVQNTGLEFVLQTDLIQKQNFQWTSYFNLTFPNNKLIVFPDLESSSYASHYEIGKPLSILNLYKYTGINSETGEYTFEDVNDDGVLNNDDKIITVDTSREFYGGWQNSFQYKNWNISFLFEFVKQNGRNPITFLDTPGSSINMPIEILDRWQESDSEGEYQRYTQNFDFNYYNYASSSSALIDASFVRMKSLSFSYQIPLKILQNIGIQNAQIYINTQNLFTLSPYKGYDAQRPNSFGFPALTSVNIGLKVTL